MLQRIINASKAELEASKKRPPSARLENLVLISATADGEPVYRTSFAKKLEGDYVAYVNGQDVTVTVEWSEGNIFVTGIQSGPEKIASLPLYKDPSALRKAVLAGLENVKEVNLDDSTFIIGPAGTGKTQVISTLAPAYVEAGLRVLVIAHANKAVENAIERAADKLAHLADGEVVVSCQTDNDRLKRLSPKAIASRKVKPLEDEAKILEAALFNISEVIRDKEPMLNALEGEDEVLSNQISNLSGDRELTKKSLIARQEEAGELSNRLEKLNADTILNSLASAFIGKAKEAQKAEIESELNRVQTKIGEYELKVAEIEAKLEEIGGSLALKNADLTALRNEVAEAKEAKRQVEARLSEIREEVAKAALMDVYKDAKLVGCTLYTAALSQKINDFDVLICDEASMADASALLLACTKIKSGKLPEIATPDLSSLNEAQNKAVTMALKTRLVFVGDPKQLSCIAMTAEARKSLFEYFDIGRLFKGESVKNAVLLDINYRNHPDIVAAASKLYYGDMLKSGRESNGKKALYIKKSLSPSHSEDGSYVNLGTAQAAVDRVSEAVAKGQRSIAVISPYKKQAEMIDGMLSKIRADYPDADISAGTVHTFQGKEKGVVIFDFTYCPTENKNLPATFIGDEESECARLANVAFTRAKDFFIVLGNVDGFKNKIKSMPGGDRLAIGRWIEEIETLAYAA